MTLQTLKHLGAGGVTIAAFNRHFNSTRSAQTAIDSLTRSGLAAFNGKQFTLTPEGRRELHSLESPDRPYEALSSGARSVMSGVLTPTKPIYRAGAEDAFGCPSLVAGKRVPYGVYS